MAYRNTTPITYLTHPSLMETEEILELSRKGHNVIACNDLQVDGVVIGPNCYRISKETISLLDLVTKAERASKYGKASKK